MTKNIILASVTALALSGCGLMTALDGTSTKAFVSVDAACRAYGFSLSAASKVVDIMEDEHIEYVEDTRTVVNPICTSSNPPANDIATVQAAAGGVLALAVQLGANVE